MCGGRLSRVMNFSREVCMVVSRGVVSLASFLSFVFIGRSNVALRIYREVRREVLGAGLSPFGNLTMIALVDLICSELSSLEWRFIVRRLFQLCSPISHRGARCLSSC